MKKILNIIFILTIIFLCSKTEAANWHYTITDTQTNKRIELGSYSDKKSCENVRILLDPSQNPSLECYESKPLKINKINPTTAAVGDFIEITGENFGQIVSVLFGTTPAKNFTFTDKSIKAEIPNGVNSGNKITLKSPTRGETTSTESLTIGESSNTIDPSNETLWWFQDENLKIVGIGGAFSNTGFRSENDCNAERIKYIKDNVTVTDVMIKECFEEESNKIAILTRDQQNMEQYAIESKNRLQVAKTYKLLAPIGDFTEFDGNDIGDYLNLLVKLAIGLCGALAVIMLIVNGITYMGEGSIFKKTQAKENMQNAILGLLIALGSWALLNTINPDLLGGKGLSVRQVKLEIEDDVENEPQTTYSSKGNPDLCPSGFVDVRTDKGSINICSSMAKNLGDMIEHAKREGVILFGYGSRSIDRQIELRKKNNCPDIYEAPAEKCTPPTSRPGRSRHEAGLAVDFTCGNQTMMEAGGKNSDCFKWLDKNAKSYGFQNLASEPWHWSDNGK